MRTAAIVPALLAGLALAQDLPLDDYDNLMATVTAAAPAPGATDDATTTQTYDSTSIIEQITSQATVTSTAVIVQRDVVNTATACTYRSYNGPAVTVPSDTPDAFLAYPNFHADAIAKSDPATYPDGFALIPGFSNLEAAGKSTSYITYTTQHLSSYDPQVCADKCNTLSNCVSFNIFYERDPAFVSPDTQTPNATLCPGTPSSPSCTFIKCAFYSAPLLTTEATNPGQYQENFHLVISGSNAYARTAVNVNGFQPPVDFGSAAINAPAPVIDHGYLRIQTFGTNVPYDPSLCATSCQSQTAYNLRHGAQPCVFFNSYLLYKNGQNPVFTCTYFSTVYDSSRALMTGQYNSAGDHFTVGSSYGYTVAQ